MIAEVVTEKTLDDVYSVLSDNQRVLYDIYSSLTDLDRALDDLELALIVIIIMLGIIAGACIFRHLRK